MSDALPLAATALFNRYNLSGVASMVVDQIQGCWWEIVSADPSGEGAWAVYQIMPSAVRVRVGLAPAPVGGDLGYRGSAPVASVDATQQDLAAAIEAAVAALQPAVDAWFDAQ